MNMLKNILFFGLLIAVLCGVYLSLSRTPDQTLPHDLEKTATTTPPTVDLGTMQPAASPSSPPVLGGPPTLPSQPPAAINAPPGGDAPPFQPTGKPKDAAEPWPSHEMSGLPPPPAPPTTQNPNYPPGARDPSLPGNASLAALTPPPRDLPPPAHSSTNLDHVMQEVRLQVEQKRYADALLNLSQLYGDPDLPSSQSRQITQILDQMAAKVVFSREHLLEGPYRVQAGDTLEIIADRYKVPTLLLARINGIHDVQELRPGRELKVLKGPFWAQISTDRSEMTLRLGGSYAVRFNVVLSGDLNHSESLWTVCEKRPQVGAFADRVDKPWIDFSSPTGQVGSIHGTNDTGVRTGNDNKSTIWLSEQDMNDLYGILSVGSRIIIQR